MIYNSDTKWGMPHTLALPDDWAYSEYGSYGVMCSHEFVNTGTLKSYCKHCNVDGEWDKIECKYVEKK